MSKFNFRYLSQIILLTSLLVGASSAQAALIRVSQESSAGAGDFDANVLGQISSYDSLLTASAYYSYNNPFAASFNDGGQDVTLTSNKSHTFFVSGADGLSAFFVHDKPNDSTGGMADMTVDLTGDTASVLVKDDAGEGVTDTGGTNFVSDHNWIACCTDGFVLGALDGDGWELFAEFDSRSWGDFAGWMTFGSGNSIDLAGDIDRRVRFDVVPEPSVIALFGLGLLGLGIARRRKSL